MLSTAGLALIFGVMRMANFAQGGFVVLGMYGTVILYRAFGLDPLLRWRAANSSSARTAPAR